MEMALGGIAAYLVMLFIQILKSYKESGRGLDIWELNYSLSALGLLQEEKFVQLLVMILLTVTFINIYYIFLHQSNRQILATGMIKITDKIFIPEPAGNGQYGSAHFMKLKELSEVKEIKEFYYGGKGRKKPCGGLVIGIAAMGVLPKKGRVDPILYIAADRHSLIVGATRSGKTRSIILESIWLTVLAGENIMITDPKGELYAYTVAFAQKNDYKILTLDLRDPDKGSHNNYMQQILDALSQKDVPAAIDYTWDLVAVLVGEQKGEPIWHNGECATIAASILIVAMEAPPEYRNLTNVYYFLAFMARPDESGIMPFSLLLEKLEDDHPAKGVFAMADIAHPKTRGSFFSSALGTLKHFANPKIAEMTSKTDINFSDTIDNKTIVYIIIPDEKNTLYPLASIFIMQFYMRLVKAATEHGGRCPINWNFYLDEFGQLPYIPVMPQFTSVGAGRGIRLNIVLQSFQQLKKVYKDDYETIRNNCDTWIYLKCATEETKKEFSNRLGKYTVQSNSTSMSLQKHSIFGNGNYSNSSSLIGRPLLMEEEVGEIEKPFTLVSMAGKSPIMLISPDLSYYRANKELGLGNEEHNRTVYKKIHDQRKKREISSQLNLWKIWKEYQAEEYDFSVEEEERISFI